MIVRAIEAGDLIPSFSEKIVAEYREVLSRSKFARTADHVAGLLALMTIKGTMLDPPRCEFTSPDPRDQPFLDCAVGDQMDVIVTATAGTSQNPSTAATRS